MFRIAVLAVISLTCVTYAPATDTTQVVTTFAVPVGVPVANMTSGVYSYGQTYQAHQQQRSASTLDEKAIEKIVERVLLRVLGQQQGGQITPQTTTSLVTQHCSKCHSGEDFKGEFSIDQPLTDRSRLDGIRMLLADDPANRMPKNVTLDPQVRGEIIQELATVE